jgi:hypothetical protein
MYQDPENRYRNEQINNFLFQFDRRDKDPAELLASLDNLQSMIRSLRSIVGSYERYLEDLEDQAKLELFTIREHLFEASEQLFCVQQVINTNEQRDKARYAQKNAQRVDIRAGGIAWHLLQDNLQPLIKLDIDGTMLSYLSNKDGSMDIACVISDLSALNSNPDVLFPEVAVRYEPSGASKKVVSSGRCRHIMGTNVLARADGFGPLVHGRKSRWNSNCPTDVGLPAPSPPTAGRESRRQDQGLHLQRSSLAPKGSGRRCQLAQGYRIQCRSQDFVHA